MKIKNAKRSVSEYEESLSSQGSCHDSIIAHIEYSTLAKSSSKGSSIMIIHQCWTPPKNTTQIDQSYSLKRLVSNATNEWEEKNEEKNKEPNLWVYESQDSKIRKKQDNNSSQSRKKYKEHVKVLRFDDQRPTSEFDKENEPIKVDIDEFSSDNQSQQWINLRCKSKRMVGKVLYNDQNQSRHFRLKLPQIQQQQSRLQQDINITRKLGINQ